jgi:isoquinoline 1-oxidoreductase beta subunit
MLAVSVPLACTQRDHGEKIPGTLTAYLDIGTDGTVTLYSPISEMGQGAHAAHAVIIADELDVPLDQVRVQTAEPADPFRWTTQMYSGGSMAIMYWRQPLQKAAAQARAMLLTAAATEIDVAQAELETDSGEVIHAASGRRLAYASLTAAASKLVLPDHPPFKDPAKYRYIGKNVERIDIPATVRGEGVFASDIERPGMVYGCARLAPVFGAKVQFIDEKPALAVPGVMQVVEIPGGAAVVATNSWAAIKGAEALSIRFEKTPHDSLDSDRISRRMRAGLDADDRALVAHEEGDVAAAFAGAGRVFEAIYEAPYLAHAAMETWSCTVEMDEQGILHIWAPSQAQDDFRWAAADAANLPLHRVRIHSPRLGGAFGRWCDPDAVPGAVRAAVAVRKPLQFFWRREDQTAQGRYRSAQVARLRAAIDATGKATALDIRMSGQPLRTWLPEGELDIWNAVYGLRGIRYGFDSLHVDWVRVNQPVPVTTWRSIGASQNAYFLECFVDELARELGKDPYRLRRELLARDPRALKVIDAAAELAGWNERLQEGRARGMAFFESYNALCAQVAEVSLEDGKPIVHRVACALDCGIVVLPDAVRAQVEGSIIMGLSTALGEQIVIRDGAAVNTNFDGYRIMRMAEAPLEINTVIIDSGEAAGAGGEPPLPPAAPALANALFALTGKSVRKLPLT